MHLKHALPSTIEVQTSAVLHSELDLTHDITKITSGSGEKGRVCPYTQLPSVPPQPFTQLPSVPPQPPRPPLAHLIPNSPPSSSTHLPPIDHLFPSATTELPSSSLRLPPLILSSALSILTVSYMHIVVFTSQLTLS
ncbi:hypothetical protein BLNAU_23022 [Blattamonas nauphoetae]|uniref:Uncharacterized protein n=1 Tax=Blattamonas nauphoetae TaxID=2049346 RepID=A0ABQ9WTK4_9EUKA|nr:hypothetical protein BLNAU_23022 [Blattamonas nauphoetae]